MRLEASDEITDGPTWRATAEPSLTDAKRELSTGWKSSGHASTQQWVNGERWMDSGTAVAIAAFLLNGGLAIGGAVWAVGRIRTDNAEKIAEIRAGIDAKILDMTERFSREQSAQDHNFGEVGAAMRQKIADVEAEMHKIEIWSRDNYVQKVEFAALRQDIKTWAADIKQDFRDLREEIAKH